MVVVKRDSVTTVDDCGGRERSKVMGIGRTLSAFIVNHPLSRSLA